MKTLTLGSAAILAILSGQALADPITCSYGDLSRKIEVVYSNPGQSVPCEVIYDKSAEGTIETLWRADDEAGYCEAQAAGLVEKLTSTGWQCGNDMPMDASETTDG
jgi:hypothetical protein